MTSGFWQQHWRLILVSAIGWSLLAAIPATSAYLGSGAPGFPVWWAMFKKIGLYYYMWGLVSPFLYRLTDALPFRGKGLLLTIPVHLLVLTVLSFGFGLVSHQEASQEWLLGPRAMGYHSMSFFTYALIVLCCLAIKFYRLSLLRQREATDAKINAAQLDNQLNLARVDSLRMQMNPHFLFNALNSVAALIDSNQRDRAYDAIEQLAELLRSALNLSDAEEIPLQRELDFCRAYLAMETIRFGERLAVRWHIDEASLDRIVPAFVLQPAVENVIKHAVSVSSAPVSLTVSTRIIDATLRLEVSDDGRAEPGAASTSGLGLQNLRERMCLRYGSAVDVVSGSTANGYRTRISIPLHLLSPTPNS